MGIDIAECISGNPIYNGCVVLNNPMAGNTTIYDSGNANSMSELVKVQMTGLADHYIYEQSYCPCTG